MDSTVFYVQFALSLIVYGLLAAWFVVPWLRPMPRSRAILILIVPHAFRALGLYALTQAAFNPEIPQSWADVTAYGDAITQVAAMLALIALHKGWRAAIPCAWLCNIAGTLDYAASVYVSVTTHVPIHLLSAGWFLPVFFLPLLAWSHYYLYRFLLLREP
jgi:hypothetical protein